MESFPWPVSTHGFSKDASSFNLFAKKEGQGCFLLKSGILKTHDGKSKPQPNPKHFDLPSATRVWDGKSQSTNLLTCSDKLLLWQHLGFAAEYNVFGRKNGHLSKNEFPIVDSIPDIRLATIVVGRKFSLHHLGGLHVI